MTGDLLVPGTPAVIVKGSPNYAGTIPGNGNSAPSDYKVTLRNCTFNYLRTRTTPVTMPKVPTTPRPKGKRSVVIIHPGQSYGDPGTLRDLILANNVGSVSVPPGTYGQFGAGCGSSLTIGVAGAVEPSVYNLQGLALAGNSALNIVGPVILNLDSGILAAGNVGNSNNPTWLQMNISCGDFILLDGSTFSGLVVAPNGRVRIGRGASLVGASISADFTLAGTGRVRWYGSKQTVPPVATNQTITLAENSAANVTLTGSDPQNLPLTYSVLTQPAHGALTGTAPYLTYQPATNFTGNDSFTFDVNNGVAASLPATFSLVVTQVYFPPTAYSQTVSGLENTTLPVTLTGLDPQDYPLTFSVLTQPAHGTLSGAAPNLAYAPAQNYYGPDSFTFVANDGVSNSIPAAINITVEAVDQPPNVSPGPNQLVIWPSNTVNLSGTVTYAPFPNSADTVNWSQVSGPGNVTFGNASQTTTTATFSTNGVYVLQLYASDSYLSASNDLTVTVDAPPLVSAGPETNILFSAAVTLQGSASDDGLPYGELDLAWSEVSGPGTATFSNPSATNSQATFTTNGIYVLRLTADDGVATNFSDVTIQVHATPTVMAGPNQIVAAASPATLTGSFADDGYAGSATSEWTQVSGPAPAAIEDAASTNTIVNFSQDGIYVFALTVADGLTNASAQVTITAVNPPVAVPGASALIINWPANQVTLNGTITADGLPAGGNLTAAWSELSGPAAATLSNPALGQTLSGTPVSLPLSPVATFSTPGVYVFQLAATNFAGSAQANVVATVNQPPVVNAGNAQTNLFPATAQLSGTVTDDGLPSGGALTWSWSVVSGPGTVTFNNAGLTNAIATFSQPGEYVLQLTASDTAAISSNQVLVIEDTAPSVQLTANQVPAGTNVVTLTGTVTDDGLPAGAELTTRWALVTGPSAVTFNPPVQTDPLGGAPVSNIVQSIATFSAAGTYMLGLTADDSFATNFATVTLNVTSTPLMVSAGPDMYLSGVPATATLNGQVSEAVLPPGATLSQQWSVVGGPGTVSFGAPTAPVTTATFSTNGIYVLQLTASNGQTQNSSTVEVRVETPCTVEDPEGLAAWWPANGTFEDVVSGMDAIPGGATFTNGEVGLAFNFDGTDDSVRAPATTNYNVGASPSGLTIEFWMKPNSFQNGSVLGWANAIRVERAPFNWSGSTLMCYLGTGGKNIQAPGNVWTFTNWSWTHVAVTYDAASGQADLYINGSILTSANVGTNLLSTANDFYMGQVPGSPNSYSGQLDEISLYRRPLNPEEVYNIYASGSVGKCPDDTNSPLTVDAGPDQFLSGVPASTTLNGQITDTLVPPGGTLSQQWSVVEGPGPVVFGTPDSPVTTATFGTNGIYVLQLTADNGEQESSSLMEVRVETLCTVEDPEGLAAWWPADGSSEDVISGMSGILGGSTSYSKGEVALAFNFDGSDDFVDVPAATNYDLGSSPSGLTMEFWMKPNSFQNGSVLGWAHSIRVEREGFNWAGSMLRCYLGSGGQYVQTPGNVWINTNWTWTHVAVTYDAVSGEADLYINGAIQASANVGTNLLSTMNDFYMGQVPGSPNDFSGQLDEISLYRRPLNPEEVYNIYASASVGKCPDANNLTVYAGPSVSIATNTALLSGLVDENGQPAGANVQMQWTEYAGPGPVAFGNPTSAATPVTFSANGIYILQLSANNGVEESSGLVEVRVNVPCDDVDLSGLSAWWPADGTAQEVMSGNTAILGGSTGYATGEVATAFNFDGVDDYVWAPAATNYNVGASSAGLTIEFWMNPNSFQNGSVLGWANSIRVERETFNWTGSMLRCYLGTGGLYVQTSGNVWNNTSWKWTHVAVTYDKTSGQANIYVNGSLQGSANVGTSPMTTADDFYMGQVPGSANSYSGQLDEISLWDRPLNAADISAIYNAGSAGKCPQ